nr:non-structural protein 1ab [Bovine astrovirus]
MSLYLNRADEAMSSGDPMQLTPRFNARDYFGELRKINPYGPWKISQLPRGMFYPTVEVEKKGRVKVARILVASTVAEDEWRTFHLDGNVTEVNCEPDHQPIILAASLLHDRSRLKREVSDLQLQLELTRGELAAHRDFVTEKIPRAYKLSWSTIFVLVFFGLSLCWHTANGLTTTSTTESVNPYEMLKLNLWLDSFIDRVKGVVHTHHTTARQILATSPTWIVANYVMPHLWVVVSCTLALISVYKAQHRTLSIAYLAASTISGADWMMISIASYQTIFSAVTQVFVVLVSHVDPVGALVLSFLVMFGTFLGGLVLTAADHIHQVRATSLNSLVLVCAIVLRVMGVSSLPLAIGFAVVRAYFALTTSSGQTIEIRADDGKVIAKEPNKPSLLFRFKQALGLKQVRVHQPPLVRVNPSAVYRIETPDGLGTCFLCSNYIVTAGHVIGSHKVANVTYGSAKYQATLSRHVPDKDIALLKIPAQMQGAPRLKIAQKIDPTWLCVYAPDTEGTIMSTVVPGNLIDDTLDYAVNTFNGMSGAPVVNVDGRVMGVHLTNTGFTGGAQVITLGDVTDPPKSSGIEEQLRAEIENLKKQLNQSTGAPDIVALVREAVGREFKILRSEINAHHAKASPMDQAKKGKTKRRARLVGTVKPRRQRGPVFTEEEYQELLDKGLTPDEIRDIVDAMYDKEVAGYPDWEPMSDGYDPDEDWVFESDYDFGQKQVRVASFEQYCCRDYATKDVETLLRSLSPCDVACTGPLCRILAKAIGTPLQSPILCIMDRYAAADGLPLITGDLPFTQRKVPKKRQEGPAPTPGPKIHQLDGWKTLAAPPVRQVVPDKYPVVCNLPINRPIYDLVVVDEPLLGLLPPCDPDLEFGPATWGPEAFTRSFDKFEYAQPSRFWELYKEECEFADKQWRIHFRFLEGSRVIHMSATDKNQDSTPGYPKCELYASEREYIEEHGWGPYIREFKRIDAGARPDVLWYCFLKKEQVKKDKIASADMRQIICPDSTYSRIGCCLEQDQNARMKRSTRTSCGQCGWSPMMGGFQEAITRIDKNYIIEFDWTRFDGTIPRELLQRIKDLRWEKMDPKHRERYRGVRDWYVKNLLDRYVLMPTGEVTRQRRGNPSGQISTTMDNNCVNYWLQAFEFYHLNKDSGHDLDALWREYDTLVYGDDRLNTTPILPDNYVERVVEMYKNIFGMWVKPEKVKVHKTAIGASFCGFTVGDRYRPEPTNPQKLWASLVTPVQKLPDINALYGKLLSFQILMHNSDHPFREYVDRCLAALDNFVDLPKFSEEQLERLWRGGPKDFPDG